MLFAAVRKEISLDWVYITPLLVTVTAGYFCALGVTRFLNAIGWSRYCWHPGLEFLAIWVITTSAIGLTVLPP